MKKRVIIFGNGTLHGKFLREIQTGDHVIGVDQAAYWLLTHGVTPNIAIGDFDSTTKKEMEYITKSIRIVKQFKPEKDRTDMELAIHYADTLAQSEVIIYGATGTRLDHMLATMYMMKNHILVDGHNKVRRIGSGKTIIERSSYKYISLLPYTKSITVSLTGFRYDLPKTKVIQGTSLGVSNELRGKSGVIRLFSGRAWVIESND